MDTPLEPQDHIEANARLRLYETILAAVPDLVYVFDLQHRFIYANPALLAMWGLEWEQAQGRTCLELGYEPWHAAMHDDEIERVVATRAPIRNDVPFHHSTLGWRVYDYIFIPVFGPDGQVEAVAGTTRDVTERKQQEDALRRSEQRLSAIVNASSDLIYRLCPDWTELAIVGVHGATDLPRGETMAWSADRIHPEDQERAWKRLRSLCLPQPFPWYGAQHPATVIRTLEGIRHRQRRDGTMTSARRSDPRIDHIARGERPRAIVHQHDLTAFGQHGEPSRDRVTSRGPARHHTERVAQQRLQP